MITDDLGCFVDLGCSVGVLIWWYKLPMKMNTILMLN